MCVRRIQSTGVAGDEGGGAALLRRRGFSGVESTPVTALGAGRQNEPSLVFVQESL